MANMSSRILFLRLHSFAGERVKFNYLARACCELAQKGRCRLLFDARAPGTCKKIRVMFVSKIEGAGLQTQTIHTPFSKTLLLKQKPEFVCKEKYLPSESQFYFFS
jgi:hypothetical protein